MRREAGFTLIELLVAITLAVVLAGMAWTGLVQLKRSAERSQALADLALEGGMLYRRFDDDVARTLQQVQVRLETPALDAAVYGAGARAVRLIGMCEMYNRTPNQGIGGWQADGTYQNTALWYCWEWRPPTAAERAADAQAPGSLWYGRSSPGTRNRDFTVAVEVYAKKQVPDPNDATKTIWVFDTNPDGTPKVSQQNQTVTFKQVAQAWRSRRADLADNDLRLVPGAAAAPGIRLTSDRVDLLGEDLDRDGAIDPGEDIDGDGMLAAGRLLPVCRRVAACTFAWVDYGGWTTTASTAGVAVADAAGATVAAGTDPWWTASQRVVDGLFRDARDARTDRGRTVLQARPGLIRIELTLSDRRSGLQRPLRFAITPDLGAPAATGL